MANSSGSSRQAKRQTFDADSQQRIEQNAQTAGLADAFGKLGKLGPQVLVLQQALLGGLQRSQKVESKRLAARHGEKDGRVEMAARRASRYAELQAEAESQVGMAGRIVETVQSDGIFSGYVYQNDGTAAYDHTVRIEVSVREQKNVRRASAKTAADGYFRMILSGVDKGDTRKPTGLDDVVDKVVRALHAEPGKVEVETVTATSPPLSDDSVTSRVEVVDPGGRVVHEDPVPPTFDDLGSEFRTYLLSGKSTDGTTPKPNRKGRKAR